MTGDIDDIRRRYFVGLAKTGDTVDAPALAGFALAAMRSRFEREARPAQPQDIRIVLAGEPLLPEAARSVLVRLCSAKPADNLAAAAARALERAGVRPHPFDFHRLEEFIVRFADCLGRTARDWASHVRAGKTEVEAGSEAATEESFSGASRAAKHIFLRRLLSEQPARARIFLAQVFASEPAIGRGDILDMLAAALQESDLAFLKIAAADNAKSVRDKAVALLANVPGTEGYRARLAKLPDYIKVKTAMLSRRKSLTVVGLAAPAGAKLSELLGGLRLADIARALDLGIEEFAGGAAAAGGLDDVVLRLVIVERRFDLLKFYEETLKDAGWVVGNILQEALPLAAPADRENLIRLCIAPRAWTKIPEAFTLERFAAALGGPLPDALAQELIQSKAWREMLQKEPTPQLAAQCDALAPLLPRCCSERFVADVQTLAPRAALFHRFLLALPTGSS